MNNQHQMENQSSPGHGRWKQCAKCGAAQHGGYFWFGNSKSKVSPPCTLKDTDEMTAWINNAIPQDDGEPE